MSSIEYIKKLFSSEQQSKKVKAQLRKIPEATKNKLLEAKNSAKNHRNDIRLIDSNNGHVVIKGVDKGYEDQLIDWADAAGGDFNCGSPFVPIKQLEGYEFERVEIRACPSGNLPISEKTQKGIQNFLKALYLVALKEKSDKENADSNALNGIGFLLSIYFFACLIVGSNRARANRTFLESHSAPNAAAQANPEPNAEPQNPEANVEQNSESNAASNPEEKSEKVSSPLADTSSSVAINIPKDNDEEDEQIELQAYPSEYARVPTEDVSQSSDMDEEQQLLFSPRP